MKNSTLYSWNLKAIKSYIPQETPLQISEGLQILGHFPYEKAYIRGDSIVRVSPEVFSSLEKSIRSKFPIDNKIVIIIKETWNNYNKIFAYHIKDNWRSVGNLKSLTDYQGLPLK